MGITNEKSDEPESLSGGMINLNDRYRNKYLKYKIKYIALKN
jgi:hypothetical protein